jgi:S1-C subfamily serine protease
MHPWQGITMRLEWPDLLGLAIGFALGGVGLAAGVLLTQNPPAPHTDPPPARVAPPPPVQPPVPRATLRGVPPPPTAQGAPALPSVVRPTDDTKPDTISGTGFFIADDGTILTAAHVVDGCRMTQIASRQVPRSEARLLAAEPHHDLALLRAPVRPPALIGFADRTTNQGGLTVYGYPAGGDLLLPTEAAARARPDIRHAAGTDQVPGMWIEAGDVGKGFSGGPVVTAHGEAIGLIQAVLRRSAVLAVGLSPRSGVALGPDSRTITAFLREQAPDLDPAPTHEKAGDTNAARQAVVHVFCWR